MERYLVIAKDNTAFWSAWFNAENNWNAETIHAVIDFGTTKITFDGETWNEIGQDHL